MGFIILSRGSQHTEMCERAKPAESDEAEGFTLARVEWFPYNPVDFYMSRGNPAGIAVVSPNGQPKKH
jgi:hypothetical protein